MEFLNITQATKVAGISYLGTINQSSKLTKNLKISNVLTYSLYLSPSKISGYNVCPDSTPECRMGCLNTSGLAKVEYHSGKTNIKNARNIKTKLLFEHTEFFMNLLVAEIESAIRKSIKLKADFSVRLNCTSDVDWTKIKLNNKNIFEIFPDVKFYDYTKNIKKFDNKPINYNLTFSYTGNNWINCLKVLDMGYNIAMVFNINKKGILPMFYKGIEIINGDITDYRIDDKRGVIVGLKWKKIANNIANEFVRSSYFCIQPNNSDLIYETLEVFKDEKLIKIA